METIRLELQDHTLDTIFRLCQATGKDANTIVDIAIDLSIEHFVENEEVFR